MNRVGAVAYSMQYSLGMLSYQKRQGDRDSVYDFIEKIEKAGGEAAMLYANQIETMDASELRRLRSFGEQHGVRLELHGGGGYNANFESLMEKAVAIGSDIIGIIWGMMPRPDKTPTFRDWEEQYANKAKARFRELLPLAEKHKLKLAMENHLDFTVDELRTFLDELSSPYAGVVLDIGNSFGTVEDPTYAAEQLAKYTFATHVKDFAVEETARGYRLTMTTLGAGSTNIKEIMRPLVKAMPPEANICIEILSGQELDINWVEDRFWEPFRDLSARKLAATLRHIRSTAINIDELKGLKQVDALPHEQHMELEFDRLQNSISYLKNILGELEAD